MVAWSTRNTACYVAWRDVDACLILAFTRDRAFYSLFFLALLGGVMWSGVLCSFDDFMRCLVELKIIDQFLLRFTHDKNTKTSA